MSGPAEMTAVGIRCVSWCGHIESGYDPFMIALAIAAHWRDCHADLLEANFLGRCVNAGCGRLTVARYCCERCLAADDGGPALAPWNADADPVEVHDQACEDRARARDLVWYAGSAR